MSDQDREFKLKQADLLIKVVGVIVTLLTITVGLYQYLDKQMHESAMEFKRTVWKNQLATYSEACKYAGLIAMNPHDADEFNQNVKAFGGLYWGEMIMVEDPEVEKAMKDFYYAIIDFSPTDQKAQNKLKFKADQLAKACRKSSQLTWKELE